MAELHQYDICICESHGLQKKGFYHIILLLRWLITLLSANEPAFLPHPGSRRDVTLLLTICHIRQLLKTLRLTFPIHCSQNLTLLCLFHPHMPAVRWGGSWLPPQPQQYQVLKGWEVRAAQTQQGWTVQMVEKTAVGRRQADCQPSLEKGKDSVQEKDEETKRFIVSSTKGTISS